MARIRVLTLEKLAIPLATIHLFITQKLIVSSLYQQLST